MRGALQRAFEESVDTQFVGETMFTLRKAAVLRRGLCHGSLPSCGGHWLPVCTCTFCIELSSEKNPTRLVKTETLGVEVT